MSETKYESWSYRQELWDEINFLKSVIGKLRKRIVCLEEAQHQ